MPNTKGKSLKKKSIKNLFKTKHRKPKFKKKKNNARILLDFDMLSLNFEKRREKNKGKENKETKNSLLICIGHASPSSLK